MYLALTFRGPASWWNRAADTRTAIIGGLISW